MLPAVDYLNHNTRTEGEMKLAFEDFLKGLKQVPGAGVAEQALTLATDAITPAVGASGIISVDTEAAAAADNLATIVLTNVPDGSCLWLRIANNARVVTIKHLAGGSGQISLRSAADLVMTATTQWLCVKRTGTLLEEQWRSGKEVLKGATADGLTLTGGLNHAKTTVASATTPDIFATTVGDYIDYTGTVSCTGFVAATQAGAERELRCAGAAPFVAGANMLIDGYASGETFTATADDRVIVRAETTTQFRLTIRKRNAKSINSSLPFVIAGGTADAITANFTPDLVLADEPIFALVMGAANATTTPTLAVDGGTARTIVKKGGSALVAGDIPGALAVCLFKYNLAGTRYELLNPAVAATLYAVIADSKASGTTGGDFTSGAWRTRTLNTELYDPNGLVSLSANQFTLGAGTWLIEWSAPAQQVNRHHSRLYNITTAGQVAEGTSELAGAGVQTRSVGHYGVTLSGSTVYELQHQCATTRASEGFGDASGTSFAVGDELYAIVKISKIG